MKKVDETLENKTRWFIIFCCLILVGGAGLKLFKRNEEQKREQELVRMETTVKEIKHTFAEVKEIEFSEEFVENDLAGFTSIDVTITTKDAIVGTIGIDFSPNNKAKTLESYAGGTEFKKGTTKK
ncbi:hypothetical protein [uncultured Vagococcus sp.]|uniref:hypothetical protein n=1 Tax=uncultured Vagococcus sp. TaxID=189676 RepID=UPI0028D612B4|nr:hypothetical protein [uncultured Vagococcus sp.]